MTHLNEMPYSYIRGLKFNILGNNNQNFFKFIHYTIY